MLRKVQAAGQATVLGLWTFALIPLAIIASRISGNPTLGLHWAHQLWAPGVLSVLRVRSRVEGLERVDLSRPSLFISTHASNLDAALLFAALPIPLRFLAKAELESVPFIGWFIRAMGMVFIDRRDPERARRSIERLSEVMAAGHSVVAFPEGTRSRTGEVGPFKTGAFAGAILAKVPVVPVRILGSHAVLPAGGFKPQPGDVSICFGRPIATTGLTVDDRHSLARDAREVILQLRGESGSR